MVRVVVAGNFMGSKQPLAYAICQSLVTVFRLLLGMVKLNLLRQRLMAKVLEAVVLRRGLVEGWGASRQS